MIATRKFARVFGDETETDPRELSLEEACMWARDALNSFKVFVEKALDQNVFELLTPETLETLKEILRVACDSIWRSSTLRRSFRRVARRRRRRRGGHGSSGGSRG